MSLTDGVMGRVVATNNSRIAAVDPVTANPRPLDDVAWHHHLVASLPTIAAEWAAFVSSGGRLPHIEDVLGEDQGNTGAWRVGVVVADGSTTRLGRRAFPRTGASLRSVPGLRAALWSVLDPGTELHEHSGPNAGVLRYHLGVDCALDSALRVGSTVVPYADGHGLLFDDTVPHAAWNHGTAPRVTLFVELERPLPGLAAWRNRAVQRVIATNPRRRGIVRTADDWDAALNPSTGPGPASGS